MHAHTNAAAETHAFNPEQWLKQFEACGGYWIVTAGRLSSMGFCLNGNEEHELRAGSAWKALRANPEQMAAVKALLEGRA